mmetsp:Transcript_31269/g.105197  ORF Transcript_31269/g.105197 Transcript_31269/m.105197 type:complete len:314 (-) Transcript_31269:263-1204(-)
MVEAGLVARDARVRLVLLTLKRLCHDPRVRQERSRHGDQVAARVAQDVFGRLRVVDPIRRAESDLAVRAQERAQFLRREDKRRARHARANRGHARLVPADARVDHVDAGVGELRREGARLFKRHAVFDEFEQRQPEDEREPGLARGLPHAPCDSQSQPRAVLGGAAVVVGALVRARGEELVEQITLRAHHLNPIVAGRFRQLGAPRKVVDRALDVLGRQRSRRRHADWGLLCHRRNGERVVRVAPRVQDLHGNQAAGVVHRLCHHQVVVNLALRRQFRRHGRDPPFAVRRQAARDDEADAAESALRVELGHVV